MNKTEKINRIVEAANSRNFTDGIEDVEMLSYTSQNGQIKTDRFNYINTTTIPCSVCFIGGTGYPDFSIPLSRLTDESLDDLCACIEKQPKDIFDELASSLTKARIIEKALRDEEKPYGYLITYIRDIYNLPKTKGHQIAMDLLKHFNIDNENPTL